ncbi:type IV pilus twitching motility protein PilT [Azonexus hydrophilus]|uniref:ATPase, T2SS/T4P/T4SS family n=1 Tax=Azonexus hydrophilus TaxID=418702 RepID=A0ABZ2XLH6_9RHOO
MDPLERNFLTELTDLANSPMPFTDIRLEQDRKVSVRMPDGWRELDELFEPSIDDLDLVLKNLDNSWEETIKKEAINRPFTLSEWRLRINACLIGGGERVGMIIRRNKKAPPELNAIGIPGVVRTWLTGGRGLILITGATRSGKTTTAAAMLDAINRTRAAHVVTIEDPIEYVHEHQQSIFSQREVGVDTATFEDGLQDALRQCPDIIMVGEIRNRATAETALLAGESGHLVIGTLHANSAVGAVGKMLSWFNDNERIAKTQTLAGSLIGVIHQTLLSRKDKSGYALACEVLNNADGVFSEYIGQQDKLASYFDREENRNGSVLMAKSLGDLVANDICSKVDVFKAAAGIPGVAEKLKANPVMRAP